MTLFSDSAGAHSHRTRIVLSEKDIAVDIVEVDPNNMPEDLPELNPYNAAPTLVDRDLVLYGSQVIMEYFDERYPHPPLMPVDPVSRAKARLALYRIETDWYSLLPALASSGEKKSGAARKMLEESLLASIDIFKFKPFFLSDEFSLVDCSVAPILWRLDSFGIELPNHAKAIKAYGDRIFNRSGFRKSLTEAELELRS